MDLISIGKIVATKGIAGECILVHALEKKSNLKNCTALFIETVRHTPLPFFIEKATGKTNDEVILKLEGVNSKEEAKALMNKGVWLKKEEFDKEASTTSLLAIIGYALIENKMQLGIIESVIEQPHQMICTITINDKEVLIPLHDKTLLKIDRAKKQVIVQLPEGLLEVYLM